MIRNVVFSPLCFLVLHTLSLGQITMVKQDFAPQGVSIIVPSDSEFGNELQKLGFSVNPSPYSIVVKNKSTRSIVALGLRFTKRYTNGHVATSDIASSQPSALLDVGQTNRYDHPLEGLVMPGAAQLFTPDGRINPGTKSGTTYRTAVPWTIIKVQIDSVVFDDGEAIGQDQINVVKRLKLHINAQQDLMEEISRRLSQGEDLHSALQYLQQSTSVEGVSENEVQSLTASSLDKVYLVVRRHYLDEISETEAKVGDEIAMRRLRQLKYTTRPNIHYQTGGN